MANEKKKMSAVGIAALRKREQAVFHYYNDAANNCTYGVGALVHYGSCSAEEFNRPVSIADVNQQLANRVHKAESAVCHWVTQTELSQDQFDALVSFTFNVGATGARESLRHANRGEYRAVAEQMRKFVYVHPRDENGKKLPSIRLAGLVNRRKEELAPFEKAR